MALKAQAQCRATLETLAEIKNPQPTAFLRQANIAYGPQQVNNGVRAGAGEAGTDTVASSRAENHEERQIELLQAKEERVDAGTARPAGARDPAVATVAALDWSEDR